MISTKPWSASPLLRTGVPPRSKVYPVTTQESRPETLLLQGDRHRPVGVRELHAVQPFLKKLSLLKQRVTLIICRVDGRMQG